MHRRALLLSIAGWPALSGAPSGALAADHSPLRFPSDFGAHPETRTEWWYVTGTLQSASRLWGFQVTFFRSSTGIGAASGSASSPQRSRFNPAQLVFAHCALSDLEQRRLRHDQRIARSGFEIADAKSGDTGIVLRDWQMSRAPLPGDPQLSRYTARIASDSAGFRFDLQFDSTQPVLLQGDGGVSKKGPAPEQFSRYYSQPQLDVQGTLTLDGKPLAVQGRAWLDHEWSNAYMAPQAVGWDWIGMNLIDESALTAFRLRRADGTVLYAGGSFRAKGRSAETRSFGPDEVRFTPMRTWESAASRARYPVQWKIETPAGSFIVNALLDNQELDSRGSTGAIYWEGLSDLLDDKGIRIGRGYLEMTGYAATLRM